MNTSENVTAIAIVGGGPAGLFMFQELIDTCTQQISIAIFEKENSLGGGMPYSHAGSNTEHITNVSDNEIPGLVMPIADWVQTASSDLLTRFEIDRDKFNEYKVLPRLFFGEYLSAQFGLLIKKAALKSIKVTVHLNTTVTDIVDRPGDNKVIAETEPGEQFIFDKLIICTGHHWPKPNEATQKGWYDSPYPPSKLQLQLDHPVGIKGASLTAIDALRTLARHNGSFNTDEKGVLSYTLNKESNGFKIVLHSRNGLLPAVRFHLEDTHLKNNSLLSENELQKHIRENDGFLSLDYIFEKDFKDQFIEKDPALYSRIKDMSIETFTEMIMEHREAADPFELLKREYAEAERSIKREESVYWKEMLATLSFAMNYPAKYLSAEDMLRLKKVLMPLISVVIAFVPQSSCKELMALHDAGLLELIAAGADSETLPHEETGALYVYDENDTTHFKTFVDCTGQKALNCDDLPFKGLTANKTVSAATLPFKSSDEATALINEGNKDIFKHSSGKYYLKVPGIAIDDHFRVIEESGDINTRIHMMAVPFIGGYNPDYSGLDFCEEASGRIGKVIWETVDR